MILLDTNYLIRSLVSGTMEARRVKSWVARDEELCTSSVAWYEFLCGPVDEDGTDLLREIIVDRVIPFAADSATEAARLFSAIGRVRSRRDDRGYGHRRRRRTGNRVRRLPLFRVPGPAARVSS